jgi:hypothetical protein
MVKTMAIEAESVALEADIKKCVIWKFGGKVLGQ